MSYNNVINGRLKLSDRRDMHESCTFGVFFSSQNQGKDNNLQCKDDHRTQRAQVHPKFAPKMECFVIDTFLNISQFIK